MIRLDISNETIIDLYFNKGLNRRQTAQKLCCSQDLIAYRLKKINLKPKNMAECVYNGKKRSIIISNSLLEILDGELLGDGCLSKYYIQADFRESFGYNKKEWAMYLINLFLDNKIPIMGKGLYERQPCGKSRNITFVFSTKNVLELGNLHKRWYVKNINFDDKKQRMFSNRKYIKMVPIDLKITPNCLLHWYIGDATVSSGGCSIHTDGFTQNEVEFLRFKLKNDIGIKSSRYDCIIHIPKIERLKLLEIIGICPVECYKYKWKNDNCKTIKARNINEYIDMKMVEKFIKKRGNL